MLLKARVRELEEQVVVLTRRKARKRKRIQTGGTVEYGTVALAIAENTSTSRTTAKKARSGSGQERTQSTQRRCGNCGGTGHNARTCQKDTEEASESDTSESYEASLGSVK